jgi:hypothetical protein
MTRIKEGRVSLCDTCKYGQRTVTDKGEFRYCSQISQYIRALVSECSDYVAKNAPDEWDFRKIAWIIEVNKRGEPLGFRPPKKGKDNED